MNYLAHLLLAENTNESRLGNFLGDFVKGKLEDHHHIYNQNILKGIRTHRQVDRFTDTHPIFLKSKKRINLHLKHFQELLLIFFMTIS